MLLREIFLIAQPPLLIQGGEFALPLATAGTLHCATKAMKAIVSGNETHNHIDYSLQRSSLGSGRRRDRSRGNTFFYYHSSCFVFRGRSCGLVQLWLGRQFAAVGLRQAL